ncbi:MAG TPA: carboxypeptidase-like regulatory domain-containing protein, partial [Dysgonamonadaceae bacterium]|nr:carboxypeptidase-like regulatory domain-containing protein [Dysgonamonadaceae bacterium]
MTKKDSLSLGQISTEKSKKGTVSDNNGYFEIDKSDQQEHLVVTYAGYVPQHIHIEGVDEQIEIILKEDSRLLDEVVITKRTPGTVT